MTEDRGTGSARADVERRLRAVDPGSVHVLFEPRATRVVLTGEIDAELGPDLVEAAEEALRSRRPVEVDAKHVTFMDSTGVAFLARLASRATGTIALIQPPELVRFLLDVTKIAGMLHIVDQEPAPAGEAEVDLAALLDDDGPGRPVPPDQPA